MHEETDINRELLRFLNQRANCCMKEYVTKYIYNEELAIIMQNYELLVISIYSEDIVGTEETFAKLRISWYPNLVPAQVNIGKLDVLPPSIFSKSSIKFQQI